MRMVKGNSITLEDARPVQSLGSPDHSHCTLPEKLSNAVELQVRPYATYLPRIQRCAMTSSLRSSRMSLSLCCLSLSGIRGKLSLPSYDLNMGSYQKIWRDLETGLLGASMDFRRAAKAGGM
jgi:hypothetical protein